MIEYYRTPLIRWYRRQTRVFLLRLRLPTALKMFRRWREYVRNEKASERAHRAEAEEYMRRVTG